MESKILDVWAQQLFDTGKRNNLINFRDTKGSTLEVVLPKVATLFSKTESSAALEVFDPMLDDDDGLISASMIPPRADYIATYSPKIKRSTQLLLYNPHCAPITALKNIHKKAKTAIEETGVNVAYMAFGFIKWKESGNHAQSYSAPILLAPVLFENESSIDPYYVKMTEDDVIVNPTFNYKLQSEHGIRLPEYGDEGFAEYMLKVSEMVAKLGWTCSAECKIGIFSFLKINMYNDIKENSEIILGNANVRRLLGEALPTQEQTDLSSTTGELHNVVDADSSQLDAIRMAKAGESFVLQGPPGTGKSQTITNIIAESLYDGKKVLFVSEKLAALNVVYEKLKQADLAEFCLELHSHKANKKDVIGELCRTLKAKKSAVSAKADAELSAKERARAQLDDYKDELHKIRPVINMSLYSLYGGLSACRNAEYIDYVIDNIENKGEEHISAVTALLEQYLEYLPSIGADYRKNLWYGCTLTDLSYQAKTNMHRHFSALAHRVAELEDMLADLRRDFGLRLESISDAADHRELLSLLGSSDLLTPALLSLPRLKKVIDTVTAMTSPAACAMTFRSALLTEYGEDILKLDSASIYAQLTERFSNPLARLFSKDYKKLMLELKLHRANGKKPSYKEALTTAERLTMYHRKHGEYTALESNIASDLGPAYSGFGCDLGAILRSLNELKEVITPIPHMGALPTMDSCVFLQYRPIFCRYAQTIDEVIASEDLSFAVSAFRPEIFDPVHLPAGDTVRRLSACAEDTDRLDNWRRFSALLERAVTLDVMGYIDTAIVCKLSPELILPTYLKTFYRQHIERIVYNEPILSDFTRISQDKAVRTFCEKDELGFEISKAQIKAELSADRPSLDVIASGSAVSILLREGEKKRKQKSIRTLFAETGELVQVLKPCFLMSPLSVSTFLTAGDIHFDLIIFDEASQIFPQDAVGAIYRGDQLIVVGDSKQMPPSNFFNASTDAEDDDGEDEDLDIKDFESILDMCSTSLPQLRLKWHYRSRYEQLIAFSNKSFYDGDLVTFPSAKTDKPYIGVDYHYVGGVFDHETRSNLREAEYIVDLIYENLQKFPERSLGVVAFSISQQALIDRLLAKRRRLVPEMEPFFRSDRPEPFFIKNLETVQGDERDTIIFSIGYAKDSSGKLKHNFGPLNKLGGERRLNVAVTRAKLNVQVVTSMHYTEIEPSRTKSEGALLLRDYLNYAEHGAAAVSVSLGETEESYVGFENEVCELLRSKGYTVDQCVGCSSSRVDIGIKLKGYPDYLLAIECDGGLYRDAKNARDRDRLRRSILERMGWRYYRIWSTDWFKNGPIEHDLLLDAVDSAVRDAAAELQSAYATKDAEIISVPPTEASFEEAAVESHLEFPEYKEADIPALYKRYTYDLQALIKEILLIEAPLCEKWLLKRIAPILGHDKVTPVLTREYEARMRGCDKLGIIRCDGFLYLREQSVIPFRVPGAIRDLKHISIEELAAGMYEIVKQNISVDKTDLFHTLVKLLGFARAGKTNYDRFEEALLLLVPSKLDLEGDTVSIK